MRLLKLPIRRIKALAFSPDGRELAAGGTIPDRHGWGLWVFPVGDPAAGRRGMPGAEVLSLAYTAGGRLLSASLGWTNDYPKLHLLDPAGPAATPLPLSGRAVTAGDCVLGAKHSGRRRDAFVCHRLLADGTTAAVWEAPCESRFAADCALLPDGRAVTLGEDDNPDGGPPLLALTLRDAGGTPLVAVTPPGHTAGPLTASPDGARVVLNAGQSLFVWRTADLTAPPVKVPFGRNHCTEAAFAPDGRLFAAGNDGTVRRLDPATGATLASYTFTAGKMRSLAIAPDGLTAAVGTERATVAVFDLD